jgi:opacity protein-like surface antigen
MGAEQLSYEQLNYVTLKAGVYSPQSNELNGFDEGFNGEIAFGHYFHRNVAIEIDIGYLETERTTGGVDQIKDTVKAVPALLTGKLIYPSDKLELFVELGIGAYFVEVTSTKWTASSGNYVSVDGEDTTFGVRLGLGLNYDITPSIFLGLEGKYFWADADVGLAFEPGSSLDLDGIVVTANIGFRF